jgi:hypothetical protein
MRCDAMRCNFRTHAPLADARPRQERWNRSAPGWGSTVSQSINRVSE